MKNIGCGVLDDFLQNEDVEILADSLTQKIQTCAEKSMVKIKYVKKKKIWVTSGIITITSINKRNKMNKERHIDWENFELQSKYRTLNLLIKKTKGTFFKDKIDNNKNNPKKLWETQRASTNENNKKLK
ncbi:hypothetical protein JTB14_034244 [Gonioctena quinquepunctata]|nr:hypothetical protein JTB14_034244 [Gonioctena quinquepunctata]